MVVQVLLGAAAADLGLERLRHRQPLQRDGIGLLGGRLLLDGDRLDLGHAAGEQRVDLHQHRRRIGANQQLLEERTALQRHQPLVAEHAHERFTVALGPQRQRDAPAHQRQLLRDLVDVRGLGQPGKDDARRLHRRVQRRRRRRARRQHPITVAPAQHVGDLGAHLRRELLHEVGLGEPAELHQCLTEALLLLLRALERRLMAALVDDPARDQEVAERLGAQVRAGRHRRAVEQRDLFFDLVALQHQRAGDALLPQLEEDARRQAIGERAEGGLRARELARARRRDVGARRLGGGDIHAVVAAADDALDRGEDVLDLEWLGEELRTGLAVQPVDRRLIFVDGAGDDERHGGAVLVLAQLAGEAEAVHARHEQVADDEVERARFQSYQALFAVLRGHDLGGARGQ